MAACGITMQWCHKSEKTAGGPVSQQMAPHFDAVPRFNVFALDADALQAARPRCFQSPDLGLPFSVRDFEIDPGMRNEQMQFGNFAFHSRPFRDVIVAVGMVSSNRRD